MPAPSLTDIACAEFHRRDAAWRKRIAAEWTPEGRGALESRMMVDLLLWESIAIFVDQPEHRPADMHRCHQAVADALEKARARAGPDAPAEVVQRRLDLWHLERHFAFAAIWATRPAPIPATADAAERQAA